MRRLSLFLGLAISASPAFSAVFGGGELNYGVLSGAKAKTFETPQQSDQSSYSVQGKGLGGEFFIGSDSSSAIPAFYLSFQHLNPGWNQGEYFDAPDITISDTHYDAKLNRLDLGPIWRFLPNPYIQLKVGPVLTHSEEKNVEFGALFCDPQYCEHEKTRLDVGGVKTNADEFRLYLNGDFKIPTTPLLFRTYAKIPVLKASEGSRRALNGLQTLSLGLEAALMFDVSDNARLGPVLGFERTEMKMSPPEGGFNGDLDPHRISHVKKLSYGRAYLGVRGDF